MNHFRYKQLVLFLLPSAIILGAYFLFSDDKSAADLTEQNTLSLSPLEIAASEQMKKDTDGDGLLDWEESLWKMDPLKADTDGNGISDKEEALQMALTSFDLNATGTDSTNLGENTLTMALGQQFFADVVAKSEKNSNGKLTPENIQQISTSFVSTVSSLATDPKDQYALKDIAVSPTSAKNEIQEYGNKMGAIIHRHFDPLPEAEMRVFLDFLQTQNLDNIQKLQALGLAYKNTAIEAISISAPANIAKDHLAMINSFSQIYYQLKSMESALVDPALALVAFSQYRLSSQNARAALKNINTIFDISNIVYTAEDPGQIFNIYL